MYLPELIGLCWTIFMSVAVVWLLYVHLCGKEQK